VKNNKKVIFIDRDGVINKDPGGWTKHSYVTKPEDFKFLPGSVEALKKLNDSGHDIVVISNQAGIGKGYFSKDELDGVNRKMIEDLKREGIQLRKVYYCIHGKNDNCDCRKPKTGLLKQAEKELGIKAAGTYFIGDKESEIEAGEGMGMKTILVLSGKTSLGDLGSWVKKPDYIFDNIKEAVEFIISKTKDQRPK